MTSRVTPARKSASERTDAPQAMHDYIVALELPGERPIGRAAVPSVNLQRTEQFRRDLLKVIRSEHLENEFERIASGQPAIGRPLRLPFVVVTATPRAAARIAEMPDVAAVVQDLDVPVASD